MKLDSKYFDSIRVSRGGRSSKTQEQSPAGQRCQWAGCTKRGPHRAPKGRDSEGEYFYFCRDHVTLYNKSYNYFAGMGDAEVADFQKAAVTGHRPTWSLGVNGAGGTATDAAASAEDPLEVLKTIRGRARAQAAEEPQPRRRFVQKGAAKHLLALNLDENASAEEIRAQFKALVKLHHPDHNGGDRSSEERFREVIAAYNYLKQSGLC